MPQTQNHERNLEGKSLSGAAAHNLDYTLSQTRHVRNIYEV